MKKLIAVILMFGILIGCLASCKKKEKPYTILEEGITEFFSNQTVVEEDKVGTEKTVKINGKSITAKYEYSRHSVLFNNNMDYYSVDHQKTPSFRINPNTGKCVSFSVSADDDESQPQKTRDERLAIAKEFLKTVVDDVDAYQMTKEREFYGTYSFTFNRYLGTLCTEDAVVFDMTAWGTVTFFHSYMLGEMGKVKPPDEETLRIAREHVDQKLAEMFTFSEYTVTYPDVRFYLVKLNTKQLALRYYITAELTFPDETLFRGNKVEEIAELLIYL